MDPILLKFNLGMFFNQNVSFLNHPLSITFWLHDYSDAAKAFCQVKKELGEFERTGSKEDKELKMEEHKDTRAKEKEEEKIEAIKETRDKGREAERADLTWMQQINSGYHGSCSV